MLTRTNDNLVAVVLLACAGCVSCAIHSQQPIPAHTKINTARPPWVALLPGAFLRSLPDADVWTTRLADDYGDYLVIYSQDRARGVIFGVDRDPKTGLLIVRNSAFGQNAGHGEWSLWHEEAGIMFESQGGEWTLHHFSTLLTEGLTHSQQREPLINVMKSIEGYAI